MIRDVEYAGFASMAYLPWLEIKPGTDVYTALFNPDYFEREAEEMSVKARHLFPAYSEDPEYQTPLWSKFFENWELLYAADDLHLQKTLFDIETKDMVSNGFYAAAFINKKENKCMITFRGTDDLADTLADVDLALFNRYNPQIVCVHWFIRHVQHLLRETKYELIFTGHSLGGALAQFGHVISKTSDKSKTFNALGAGTYFARSVDNRYLIDDIVVDICRNIKVNYNMNTIDTILKTFYSGEIVSNTKESYDVIYKELLAAGVRGFANAKTFDLKFIKFNFGFGTTQRVQEHSNRYTEKDLENIKMATAEIVGMLKAVYLFREGLEEAGSHDKVEVTNFVFPDDWTANLQTRLGKVVDVTSISQIPIIDIPNDSARRVVLATFTKFGFEQHSTGNFIMYMTDDGRITPGIIRERILTNLHRYIFKIAFRNSRFYQRVLKMVGKNFYEMLRDKKDTLLPVNIMLDKHVKELLDTISHKKEFTTALERMTTLNILSTTNEGDLVLLGGYCNCNFGGIKGFTNQVKINLK